MQGSLIKLHKISLISETRLFLMKRLSLIFLKKSSIPQYRIGFVTFLPKWEKDYQKVSPQWEKAALKFSIAEEGYLLP